MQVPIVNSYERKELKMTKFCCFNEELNTIVVVNAREVKMYRMRDGFM